MSYKTYAERVDDALDDYIADHLAATGKRPVEYRRTDLAPLAGCTDDEMSNWLQQHRKRQRPGARGYRPRYATSSVGYARSAVWRINREPGTDRTTVQRNRRLQARWTAQDASDRVRRDIDLDVRSGLMAAPDDATIETVMSMLQSSIESQVALVLALLAP